MREVLRPDPSQTSRALASLAGWNFAVLTSRASARESAHKSRKRKYDIVTLVHFMRNARWSFLTTVLRSHHEKLSTIVSHSLKGLSVSQASVQASFLAFLRRVEARAWRMRGARYARKGDA